MKSNFTLYAVLCFALGFTTASVQSQTSFQYNFNSTPVLLSGTDNTVNAAYRFADVSAPLPVKYMSFDAVAANRSVNLTWVTASEMNNSHFEVERSFDRSNFKTIAVALDGFVAADDSRSYQYKDHAAELQGKTISYYRLKQIDMDGNVNYSTILAVRFETNADAIMQVSPNPFVKEITVRINATVDGNAEIKIINVNGQTMMTKTAGYEQGYNNIQVGNLNKLAKGGYVVELVIDGKVIESQKVIRS